MSELLYQIQRFHSFLWASGGAYSDFYIHNIDECCWMKDAWPVQAQALGGRHYRGKSIDQNFDTYSVEYTFADGTKLFSLRPDNGRLPPRVRQLRPRHQGPGDRFRVWAHAGTSAASSRGSTIETPTSCLEVPAARAEPVPRGMGRPDRRHPSGQALQRGETRAPRPAWSRRWAGWPPTPGQIVTYDQMLNCDHEFAPDVDKLTMDSPAPLLAGPDGKYPIPQPGIVTKREY